MGWLTDQITIHRVIDGLPVEATVPASALRAHLVAGWLEGSYIEVLDELDNPMPPKAGPGSGTDAWLAHAAELGLEVPENATRGQVIAAVEAFDNVIEDSLPAVDEPPHGDQPNPHEEGTS